jgi:hypothetical protein
MFVNVPKPSQTSLVFLDTCIIINYLLGDLGVRGFSDLLDKRMRNFVDNFKAHDIGFRITPTVKDQLKSRRDIIKRKAMENKVPSDLFAALDRKIEKRFNDLRQWLTDDPSDTSRLTRVNDFYNKHKTKPDFVRCRSSKTPPSPLPEESDRMLLSEAANNPDCYLMTADCDFYTLDEEISKEFRIFVISEDNMYGVMTEWGWSF